MIVIKTQYSEVLGTDSLSHFLNVLKVQKMKCLNYLLLTIAALCCCSKAIAATYYVDARNGNDGWSGTTPDVSAANGPWQSIAKVNAAPLQPGDQVLFSCSQTWYEPLKPGTNGTATAKIFFGSYPTGCSDKPKISGFQSLPSHNWQPYQGNIWKTTFPQNLIINSSLSTSGANWSKWPSDATQAFIPVCPLSNAGCMLFLAGATTNASLAISNQFSIVGGQKYVVTMSFYAPSDTSVWLIIREHGNSYRPLGLTQNITGNGQWKDVSIQFTASQTLNNARLDIEVPKAKRIYMRNVRVQESDVQPKPSAVLFNGDPVTIAHHPNAGHDVARPESVFLRTTAVSPTVPDSNGHPVSPQIIVSDLKLPSGGSIGPGTKLILRDFDYEIHNYTVTEVGKNTITFAPNTAGLYSKFGWGFYFSDELWMLDSAGEWYFDNTTQTLYIWTPTSETPDNRVSIATIETAIDLSTKSNLTVENLEIDGASTGIDISNSQNITLRYLNIYNIEGRAIEAVQSISPTIATNRIIRAGLSAIHTYISTNADIVNNELGEIGVFLKGGKRISLPMRTETAIFGGSRSLIQDNSLSDIAQFGITGQYDSDINSNVIQRSCFSFNDCGAIYVNVESTRTVISNNLVLEVPGDLDGLPNEHQKLLIGIYLDMGVAGVSVTGNTVKGATRSINLHNSGQTTISGNVFYGSTDRLLMQDEEPTTAGVLSGNIITNNQFFPTTKNVAIHNNSTSGDVFKFATYSNNHYSTIYSPTIVSEEGLGFTRDYTFLDWQTAKTTGGIARNNDLSGNSPAPLPSFAQGTVGNNFTSNSDFSAGLEGWGYYNVVAPYADIILEGCLPVSVNCMHVIAGASDTLINSPKFAITKGKLYRVTFDLKTTFDNAFLYPKIRFAGPKYDDLAKTPRYASSTEWERHSFVFEATDTAANPATNAQSARFDIAGISAGQSLWIANLEIAPFDQGVFGPTRSELLANVTDIDKAMDCPTLLSNPGLCSNYVTFPEGTVAVWPISVPPRSGRIVFTQNLTLLDSDGDGIADPQDECQYTVKGLAVNGKGCSLTD